VWKLPAEDLLFINRGTMRVLNQAGIKTIGEVANAPVEFLEKVFGKIGTYLHKYANGEDDSTVKHKDYSPIVKSIGNNETTYRDMETPDDVWRVINMLADSVASRLRAQHFKCRTVKLYIREYDLKFCDRQGKLERPSFLAKDIAAKAMDIFQTRYNFTKPLRSIGVRACDLLPDNIHIQLSLFDDAEQDKKAEAIEKTIDEIRYEYGYDSIKRGIVLMDPKLTYVPKDYNRSLYL
jgi:DNA polymerase-4